MKAWLIQGGSQRHFDSILSGLLMTLVLLFYSVLHIFKEYKITMEQKTSSFSSPPTFIDISNSDCIYLVCSAGGISTAVAYACCVPQTLRFSCARCSVPACLYKMRAT